MLMVLLDLFPAGAIQFKAVVDQGLWFGRSAEFIEGDIFKSFTWLRGIGATVFYAGGVIPLVWFVITRMNSIKKWQPEVAGVPDIEPLPEPMLQEAD